MNVPQVYYWSVDMDPPHWEDTGLPAMKNFRFRTGVWFCGRGACRFDPQISVTIVFTQLTEVSEHIVTQLLFDYLWRDEDFDQPREDEEGICWTFSRLYWLLTDWQNIIGEVLARLEEAEDNSHGRHLPVKTRTRRMHIEVDRIYDMKEYLHFHMRAFKKLQKLKDDVPKNEQKDPLWADMDDAVEDLEQFESTLDGLKDRKSFILIHTKAYILTKMSSQASTTSSNSNSTSPTPSNPTTPPSSPPSQPSSSPSPTSPPSSA